RPYSPYRKLSARTRIADRPLRLLLDAVDATPRLPDPRRTAHATRFRRRRYHRCRRPSRALARAEDGGRTTEDRSIGVNVTSVVCLPSSVLCPLSSVLWISPAECLERENRPGVLNARDRLHLFRNKVADVGSGF